MSVLAKNPVSVGNQWGRLTFNSAIGNLGHLAFSVDDRVIEPLHTAPWVGEADNGVSDEAPPVVQALSGDFFCAPFGPSDIEEAPAHGWSANSAWEIESRGADQLHCLLARTVMGATIEKHLHLSANSPLLYQTHLIKGGTGGLPVAHHPMIKLGGAGRFSTSPKRRAITSAMPLEPDRNRLACPAQTTRLEAFPGAKGGHVDLSRLPIASRHEDFITLVEAKGARLGWSAIVRHMEDDIVFVLKDPRVLPVTMLWHSNGGRDYAPWNGRHSGVVGIEDGCAAGDGGHRAALSENPIGALGVATALPLAPGRTHRIAHVIGALPLPPGWQRIADIAQCDDKLKLTEEGGASRAIPFDWSFFDRAEPM